MNIYTNYICIWSRKNLYLLKTFGQFITNRSFNLLFLLHNLQKSSNEDEAQQKVGISGGFLSSIVQSDSIGGGIRLNITSETIQSIFRTYPAGFFVLLFDKINVLNII